MKHFSFATILGIIYSCYYIQELNYKLNLYSCVWSLEDKARICAKLICFQENFSNRIKASHNYDFHWP